MADLKISELMKMQNELQEKYKGKWEPIEPRTGRSKLLWMIEEIGEVVSIIKKRDEDGIMNDEKVRQAFVEELSDVLMYYTDVLSCYGISAEEISEAYIKKNEKNLNRDFIKEHNNYLK